MDEPFASPELDDPGVAADYDLRRGGPERDLPCANQPVRPFGCPGTTIRYQVGFPPGPRSTSIASTGRGLKSSGRNSLKTASTAAPGFGATRTFSLGTPMKPAPTTGSGATERAARGPVPAPPRPARRRRSWRGGRRASSRSGGYVLGGGGESPCARTRGRPTGRPRALPLGAPKTPTSRLLVRASPRSPGPCGDHQAQSSIESHRSHPLEGSQWPDRGSGSPPWGSPLGRRHPPQGHRVRQERPMVRAMTSFVVVAVLGTHE